MLPANEMCALLRKVWWLFLVLLLSGCTQSGLYNDPGVDGKQSLPVLRVGVAVQSPPFVFPRQGDLQGLEVDFARKFGSEYGFRPKFVRFAWEKLLPALEDGKIDVIMSGMTITQKRSYRVAFAKPYLRSGQMLLVRSTEARRYADGLYSLMGNKPLIALVEGTTGDFFITKNIHGARVKRFATPDKAVAALIGGDVDVVVHDAPIVRYYAAVNEKQKLYPVPQLASEEYLAWAVAKDNVELLQQLNRFIDQSRADGSLDSVITRWLPR